MSAEITAAIVRVAQSLNRTGLNQGTSGNDSARSGMRSSDFWITPTALPYDALTPADLVLVTSDGRFEGRRAPSSEWQMHAAVYAARADLGAIVHAHSPYCTALACLRRDIPAFHYMVAVAGGSNIRCAPYATFGTTELGALAVRALEGRRACLLANHGLLCAGDTPEAALALAIEVEALAAQYHHALQIGTPALLDEAEMQRVLARFESYKSPSKSSP